MENIFPLGSVVSEESLPDYGIWKKIGERKVLITDSEVTCSNEKVIKLFERVE